MNRTCQLLVATALLFTFTGEGASASDRSAGDPKVAAHGIPTIPFIGDPVGSPRNRSDRTLDILAAIGPWPTLSALIGYPRKP